MPFIFFLSLTVALVCVVTFIAIGYVVRKQRRTALRVAAICYNLALIPLLAYASKAGAAALTRFLLFLFTAQMIFSLLVLMSVFFRWIFRKFTAQDLPVDAARRKFLKGAAAYPVVAAGMGSYGVLYEAQNVVDHYYTIPVKAEGAFADYVLAQISDVHLGLFFSLEQLEALLERIAQKAPRALLITGDIFDDERLNEAAVKLVDSFTPRFPDGIYFCRGNHEYFRNMKKTEQWLRNTRIHELVNDSICVRDGEVPLYFAGVDYPMDRSNFKALQREYAEKTFATLPKKACKVLLSHHPDFIEDAFAAGIDLTLAGHTHGGQFGIFGLPIFPVFKYTRGMVREGDCHGYVHVGNGSWFPLRIGCPPEIAYFTLKKGG